MIVKRHRKAGSFPVEFSSPFLRESPLRPLRLNDFQSTYRRETAEVSAEIAEAAGKFKFGP